MSNLQEVSKSEYLKESIFDLLNLIERANNSIIRHKSFEIPDNLAIEGFKRIRQQNIDELNQIMMSEFGLQIDKNKIEVGNTKFVIAT
jgi:hypothetical protein